MHVAVERDVGDRVVLPGDERAPVGEAALERAERLAARRRPAAKTSGSSSATPVRAMKRADAELRLHPVLLEEHPLVDARTRDAVGGQQRRALREVEQDGAGLRQERAVVDSRTGTRPSGLRARCGSAARGRGTGRPAPSRTECRATEQDAALQAVARRGVLVEAHGSDPSRAWHVGVRAQMAVSTAWTTAGSKSEPAPAAMRRRASASPSARR